MSRDAAPGRPPASTAAGAGATSARANAPPPGALRRVWVWLALAPLAWGAHEATSYVGAFNACRAGAAPRAIPWAATVVALAVLGAASVGLARARRTYPHADLTGGTPRGERAAFLALFGGVLAALALTGVLLGAGAAFVDACR